MHGRGLSLEECLFRGNFGNKNPVYNLSKISIHTAVFSLAIFGSAQHRGLFAWHCLS